MWMYLVATFMIPSTILVLAPFDIMLGVIVSVIVYLAIVIPMALTSPVILVTDSELKVGKAHITREFISTVSVYSGSDAFAARGTDLDARAWILLRGWINPVVRVDINDPADPTPYWLFSSRKPEELVLALRSD